MLGRRCTNVIQMVVFAGYEDVWTAFYVRDVLPPVATRSRITSGAVNPIQTTVPAKIHHSINIIPDIGT